MTTPFTTTSTAGEEGISMDYTAPDYSGIATLMARRPEQKACYDRREFEGTRLAWLLELADALHEAGLNAEADSVHDTALDVVRTAVTDLIEGSEH